MKLHPRALAADRGNFTAAVGGREHAETPPNGMQMKMQRRQELF